MLVFVEVGGIAAKIRLNDYRNVYMPAVEYVRAHAHTGDQVFTTCSFGFGYGFDNIIDDDSLGYYSGKRPAFIVMEEIVDAQQELMKTYAPAKYHHAREMLDSYKLVYHNSEYRVYQRPDLVG